MMRKLAYVLLSAAACLFAAYAAQAAEIKAPGQVPAGTAATVHTAGSGKATLWIIGPGSVAKRDIQLGEDVSLEAQSLRSAGRYLAVVRQGTATDSAWFYVKPENPANLNFLARPSRVPVDRHDAISGVVFLFDSYRNLVLEPTTITFTLSVPDAPAITRRETSKNGIAWLKLDSTRKQGAAQFVASINDAQARRIVQETASDPCNLRMKAEESVSRIIVETDPVRDCSGNPVPDGTIVTFTQVDANGRSTVDARVKKGIARAELPPSNNATISVASGVVLGNEIYMGGAR
jgi:hypothetical protein